MITAFQAPEGSFQAPPLRVVATETIAAGDELCIAYDPACLLAVTERRRAHLQRRFGFTCHCERCTYADGAGAHSALATPMQDTQAARFPLEAGPPVQPGQEEALEALREGLVRSRVA
jgi:hypothetical protein